MDSEKSQSQLRISANAQQHGATLPETKSLPTEITTAPRSPKIETSKASKIITNGVENDANVTKVMMEALSAIARPPQVDVDESFTKYLCSLMKRMPDDKKVQFQEKMLAETFKILKE